MNVHPESTIYLYAYKDRYESRFQYVSLGGPDGGYFWAEPFTLPYLLWVSADPSAFNEVSKTLTFSATTSAPEEGTVVWLELPNESMALSPTSDPSTPSGYTKWVGTGTVSPDTQDGWFSFKTCALDSGSVHSCDAESTLALTLTKTGSYVLDRVAPTFSAREPAPDHNTVSRRPFFAIDISDPLSRVDGGSATLSIDGVQVASGSVDRYTGDTMRSIYYSPAQDLTLGIHQALVTSRDRAGNLGSFEWEFNVATIQATAASASILSKTVSTNPSGSVVPPEYLTISGVTSTMQPYTVELSSSAKWSGYGAVARAATLNGLKVTFQNEAGLTQTVTAPATSTTFKEYIAVLEPSTSTVTASLGERRQSLPSVTVKVPAGFGTPGSTATIFDASPAASIFSTAGYATDPLPSSFAEGEYLLEGGVGVDPYSEVDIFDGPNGPAWVSAGTSPRLHYPCVTGSETTCYLWAMTSEGEPTPPNAAAVFPNMSCSPSTRCQNLFPDQQSVTSSWVIPDSEDPNKNLLSVWQSVWAFGASSAGGDSPVQDPQDVLLWQHSVGEVQSSKRDLNGIGCYRLKLSHLENITTSRAAGWANSASGSDDFFAPTRRITPETLELKSGDPQYGSSRSFTGSGGGEFRNDEDVEGNQDRVNDMGLATKNWWQGEQTEVKILTGSTYRRQSGTDGYRVSAGSRFLATFVPRCS